MKRATIYFFDNIIQLGISIHALVKRATISRLLTRRIYIISIHALVKRATFDELYLTDIIQISIHALVKRATLSADKK